MPQFQVFMQCVVRKYVTCECETAEQARITPWEYAIDEVEADQIDWEVISVKEGDQ